MVYFWSVIPPDWSTWTMTDDPTRDHDTGIEEPADTDHVKDEDLEEEGLQEAEEPEDD